MSTKTNQAWPSNIWCKAQCRLCVGECQTTCVCAACHTSLMWIAYCYVFWEIMGLEGGQWVPQPCSQHMLMGTSQAQMPLCMQTLALNVHMCVCTSSRLCSNVCSFIHVVITNGCLCLKSIVDSRSFTLANKTVNHAHINGANEILILGEILLHLHTKM